MMNNKKLWIDTRLTEEEMNFLWDAISEENKKDASKTLAGEISKSEYIEDKDNWFYETTLKKHVERLFYDDWDNYRKYHIVTEEKEHPLPKFEMNRFWVNYQYQHEFNPLHFHTGLYSFVIFMKIPTHWEEQHGMNNDEFRARVASDFMFVWSGEKGEEVYKKNFQMSSEDEGRMLFFPAWLQHMVYPFYNCDKERITISGNIRMYDPRNFLMQYESKKQEGTVNVYEQKEKSLKIVENSVRILKEELKELKKEREKDGTN